MDTSHDLPALTFDIVGFLMFKFFFGRELFFLVITVSVREGTTRASLLDSEHGNHEIAATETTPWNTIRIAAIGWKNAATITPIVVGAIGTDAHGNVRSIPHVQIPHSIFLICILKTFFNLPRSKEKACCSHQVAGGKEEPIRKATPDEVNMGHSCFGVGSARTRARYIHTM